MNPERWARITELFELCIELPEAERKPVLEARCQGDAALHGEVLELCAEEARARPGFEPPSSDEWKRAVSPEGPEDLVMAAGAGNQRLYVIPSLNLVVARFGENDRGWRDPDFLALIRAAAASDN